MRQHAFTPVEGLWFLENLPCSSSRHASRALRQIDAAKSSLCEKRVQSETTRRGREY